MKAKSYLIDTYILLWWLQDHPRLPQRVKTILKDTNHTIFVSPISVLEINIKQTKGKLKGIPECLPLIRTSGFKELPIQFEHVEQVRKLPLIHKVAFDRILIAQAMIEKFPFISVDKMIQVYPLTVIP